MLLRLSGCHFSLSVPKIIRIKINNSYHINTNMDSDVNFIKIQI